jgi:hypothetical protein
LCFDSQVENATVQLTIFRKAIDEFLEQTAFFGVAKAFREEASMRQSLSGPLPFAWSASQTLWILHHGSIRGIGLGKLNEKSGEMSRARETRFKGELTSEPTGWTIALGRRIIAIAPLRRAETKGLEGRASI